MSDSVSFYDRVGKEVWGERFFLPGKENNSGPYFYRPPRTMCGCGCDVFSFMQYVLSLNRRNLRLGRSLKETRT
jgi:hypothetical protein